MDRDCGAAVVARAQTGDQHATNELIRGHLPLVYNIVGRALSGHPDTDDVVQETMLRAVHSLPSLRDPASFRSWLVAIAMNQIRQRHQAQQLRYDQGGPLHEGTEAADPGADFVGLTIIRLGLAGQRREVAEATRWLDEDDRELLSLWWLEAAGELGRAELAAAMELSPQHAAVRVQRMKTQLETARVVVRALATTPLCPQLDELTAAWDGQPSALWRKRLARHARDCAHCSRHWNGLVPAEGLLAGLALLPLPRTYSGLPAMHHTAAEQAAPGPASGSGSGSAPGSVQGSAQGSQGSAQAVARHRAGNGGHRRRVKPARRRVVGAAVGAAVLSLAAGGLVMAEQETPGPSAVRADTAAVPPPVAVVAVSSAPAAPVSAPSTPAGSVSPSPSASLSASPSPSPKVTPSASPSRSPRPTVSSAAPRPATAAATGEVQQVIDLVNTERSKAGCAPVKSNALLQKAAQGHSDDMAARNFFDHTNPDGQGPQARIDATGYRWSTWGENIAQGQGDPAAVMDSWMNSSGHRANILNCAFTELGVGIHHGSGGPWWTQDFGAPS
ncbi:sigma-70 family RNA polymerase sigma factor [Kitasatospora sp. McL0602]|uniref:sigma-70 family RNA polymerase sigma factor n=1 Tax=Kitasatospora sp. McL0602 TaxID=3439530 RepID=UPI003F888F04